MPGLFDKVKKAAYETGQVMKKDPLLQKVAENVKETVQSFTEGYREQRGQEKPCPKCRKPVPSKAKFCSNCGAKIE